MRPFALLVRLSYTRGRLASNKIVRQAENPWYKGGMKEHDARVAFRVSVATREAMEELAASFGMSLSDWLRGLVQDAIRREGKDND